MPSAHTKAKAEPDAPATPMSLPSVPITVEVKVRLQAIAMPEADGGYSIVVPALMGCITEADSLEEIQAQVADAAEAWLSFVHDRDKDAAIRSMAGE